MEIRQALTFDDCIQLGLAVPSGVTLACQRKDVARQNIFPAGHRKKANNQQIVNVEAPAGPLILK